MLQQKVCKAKWRLMLAKVLLTFSLVIVLKFNHFAQQNKLVVYSAGDTILYDLTYKSYDSLTNNILQAFYAQDSSVLAIEKKYYNGKQSGITTAYYPSGKKMLSMVYRYGEKHGDWTYFNEDGKILIKASYRNDLKNGYYVDFIRNFRGRYWNDKKHRKWEYNVGSAAYRKLYFNRGKLVSNPNMMYRYRTIVNKQGKEEEINNQEIQRKHILTNIYDTVLLPNDSGEMIKHPIKFIEDNGYSHPNQQQAVFESNPNQSAVVRFVYQGKINGLYKMYYPNGNIYRYYHYKNGELHGDWKEYRSNGSLKTRGNYYFGKKHGSWLIDLNSKNFKKEKYKKGSLK